MFAPPSHVIHIFVPFYSSFNDFFYIHAHPQKCFYVHPHFTHPLTKISKVFKNYFYAFQWAAHGCLFETPRRVSYDIIKKRFILDKPIILPGHITSLRYPSLLWEKQQEILSSIIFNTFLWCNLSCCQWRPYDMGPMFCSRAMLCNLYNDDWRW